MTEESGPAQCLTSPRLQALRDAVKNGADDAAAAFWGEMAAAGTPLVERDGERPDVRLVTFLYRAAEPVNNVVLMHQFFPEKPAEARLAHLDDTDVWYRTLALRSDLRANYMFSVNDPLAEINDDADWQALAKNWRIDPLNPNVFAPEPVIPADDPGSPPSSVFVLPDAAPQPWFGKRPRAPAGVVGHHRFSSRALGNERDIWVYAPPGPLVAKEPHHLLVLFDGHWAQSWLEAPSTLDNLISVGLIPPTIAVMIGNVERNRELPCHLPFVTFLADELLPWGRARYPITTDRSKVIVSGMSYGGLAAAFCGLERPDVFGNVLSQSGSFWWKPDPRNHDVPAVPGDAPAYGWLNTEYARRPRVPVRYYLDVGRLEYHESKWDGGPNMVDSNRWLRDVMTAKGYDLCYREFGGGHDPLSWRGTLADGLINLHERARLRQVG